MALQTRCAAALFVAMLSCACRGREASPHASAVALGGSSARAATGELMRARHFEMRVSRPVDCSPRGERRLGGTRRIGVEVTLTPLGDAVVPANPYYARLIDGAGEVHEATLGGCGTPLGPSLPRAGQTARGYVVFEVPRRATDLIFSYAPELAGGGADELEVRLGE